MAGRQIPLRDRRTEAPPSRSAMGASGRQVREATWDEAFGAIAAKLQGRAWRRIGAIAGDLCDAESMLALKDMMTSLGSQNFDCRQDGAKLDQPARLLLLQHLNRGHRGGGRHPHHRLPTRGARHRC